MACNYCFWDNNRVERTCVEDGGEVLGDLVAAHRRHDRREATAGEQLVKRRRPRVIGDAPLGARHLGQLHREARVVALDGGIPADRQLADRVSARDEAGRAQRL